MKIKPETRLWRGPHSTCIVMVDASILCHFGTCRDQKTAEPQHQPAEMEGIDRRPQKVRKGPEWPENHLKTREKPKRPSNAQTGPTITPNSQKTIQTARKSPKQQKRHLNSRKISGTAEKPPKQPENHRNSRKPTATA